MNYPIRRCLQRRAASTLSAASLADSSLTAEVAVPSYDRSRVKSGIAHLGVGGFQRSHLAVYTDDLLQSAGNDEAAIAWGICGVGLMPHDEKMRDVMQAQDNLYTVISKQGDRITPRVIGSMVDYLFAPDDTSAVMAQLSDPDTRIVSLTVTEKGYHYDPVTNALDSSSPGVQADIASAKGSGNGDNGIAAVTAPGMIVAALHARKAKGTPPFTVLSCDNLEGNGKVARTVVSELAGKMYGEEMEKWVVDTVSFPNSMVDRITPSTTPDDVRLLENDYDLYDSWPVVCEEFRQWVIEDDFCNGRPMWHKVTDGSCVVVPDVYPYELMKLRLLNTSHSALAYISYLHGERLVHEAMGVTAISDYVTGYMDCVRPSCMEIPSVDMVAYSHTLVDRFGNAGVKDQLQRLAEDGSTKMGNQMRPIILENVQAGRSVKALALAVAAYMKYMTGLDMEGEEIEIKDPKLALLQPLALGAIQTGFERNVNSSYRGHNPSTIAFVGELFGAEVAGSDVFVGDVDAYMKVLQEEGTAAALALPMD